MDNLIQNLISQKYFLVPSILIISFIIFLIMRYIVLKVIFHFFQKTSNKYDDILIEKGLFNRLSYLPSILLMYNSFNYFFENHILINRFILSLLVIVIVSCINALLSILNDFYNTSKFYKQINLKSYIQIFKLIINLLSIVIVFAVLSGQSPFYLLSGIGALTAVLMLVFKDTILSLVSSIQINSNDLFKVGDWVEAPQFGADGDVIDIALHTIKIQNWDKTISVVPTNKLVESSFKNWRGMSESGGRRIKRSILIDMNSIKFCDERLLDKFRGISLIENYIQEKLADIDKFNASKKSGSVIDKRALTNIGTYREYIKSYLKNNQNIHKNMTFLVRQLAPTDSGLPIEVYVFSSNTNWIDYEGIQSDIFDHLIAATHYFDLKIFQKPSGNDLLKSDLLK
ncbi:MAG: hypothetical protein CMG49_03120 [Candidatus Marinimicrobia bacterium]|nr:hypothetical protein [Candidatus Neomarinimicrobiota bacterium]